MLLTVSVSVCPCLQTRQILMLYAILKTSSRPVANILNQSSVVYSLLQHDFRQQTSPRGTDHFGEFRPVFDQVVTHVQHLKQHGGTQHTV